MAKNPKLSNEAANAEADAVAALLNSGYIRIYDGAQPANANTALGAQVLLAELRFGNPAFGAAVAGVATANPVTSDASANATGTAAWFRALKSDGSSSIFDGTVGVTAGSFDMVINSTAIQSGLEVLVNSCTFTAQKG